MEFRGFVRGVLARDLKKTILIVTHNLDEAKYCCDRVGMMERGRISSVGAWREMEPHIRELGFEGEDVERE